MNMLNLVNLILPPSAEPYQAALYTAPEYPYMEYAPPEYEGPDFSVWNTLTEEVTLPV